MIIVDDSRVYTIRLKALLLKATQRPIGDNEDKKIKLRLISASSPKQAYFMMSCQQFSLAIVDNMLGSAEASGIDLCRELCKADQRNKNDTVFPPCIVISGQGFDKRCTQNIKDLLFLDKGTLGVGSLRDLLRSKARRLSLTESSQKRLPSVVSVAGGLFWGMAARNTWAATGTRTSASRTMMRTRATAMTTMTTMATTIKQNSVPSQGSSQELAQSVDGENDDRNNDSGVSADFINFMALPPEHNTYSRRQTGWNAQDVGVVDKDVWHSRGALGGTHWGVGKTALGEVNMSFAFCSGNFGSTSTIKDELIPKMHSGTRTAAGTAHRDRGGGSIGSLAYGAYAQAPPTTSHNKDNNNNGNNGKKKNNNNKKKKKNRRGRRRRAVNIDVFSASIFVSKLEAPSKPKNIFEVQRGKKKRRAALKRFQDAAQRARAIGCL